MKNTLLVKNLLCEIKRTGTRFLSIFAICALGTAFFAGIRATGPDMQEAGDELFKNSRMADITVMSSKGLTKDDIKAMRAIEDVECVQPTLQADAMLLYNDEEINLSVRSMPIKEQKEKSGGVFAMRASYDIDEAPEQGIDLLEIYSGRLPQDDAEIALDALLLEDYSLSLGDEVEFQGKAGNVYFRVVGFVYSPKYVGLYERGNSSIGNGRSMGFAYVSGNAVMKLRNRLPMMGMLRATYTSAEVLVKNPDVDSAFSANYKDRVDRVIERIEAYGDMQEGTWYVEDRSANPGYDDYESNTERIGAVGDVFPLIFFIVAALVSLTTMTRMVEEQRIEMGTLKALGYGQGVIMAKYMTYAMLACVSGSLLGCIIGFWLLPTVILSAYGIMYRIPTIRTPFRLDIAAAAIMASAACTGSATLSAAHAALKEVPATLMRPKAPKAGKRVFLEYVGFIWNHMNFTAKVTARNILRYKKRFFMSVIGIAGSCSLLVTGFGLNDSIFGITEKQFSGIWNMDLQAYTYDSMPYEEVEELITQNPAWACIDSVVFCSDVTCDASHKDKRMSSVHVMGVRDNDALQGKINLLNHGEIRTLSDDGAIVTEKLADTFSLRPGDTFTVIKSGKEYDVIVSDVVENYVFHYVYMTDTYYEKVFGSTMEYNGSLISLKEGVDAVRTDEAVEELLQDQRMYTVKTLSTTMEDMNNVLGILNYIVAVLIVGSALLTFVVMLNLTNINIEERKRELATLRVLGFYDTEMYDYIFRENNTLAVIGAAVGLLFGRYMHAFIIKTCEVDMVMFVRTADTMSFVYSFFLTIVFSLIVNVMMRRKVRAIDMVESLKSAE
ncbi:MAG: ABC transporter permease [Clostridia bacterium]|nr:ABC transporter permease [Clostridia bacterium]